MRIELVKGNIVEANTDAIVNAANSDLQYGGGVCGAIFEAAGIAELQAECNAIGKCHTGHAVITKGYNLKAKRIIHAVGPIYRDSSSNKYLSTAYYNSLKVANENGLTSIAFPSISTGIYGFPIKEAIPLAVNAFLDFERDYPNTSIREIQFWAFSDETYNLFKTELINRGLYFRDVLVEVLDATCSLDYAARPFYLMYLNKEITKDQLISRLSYFGFAGLLNELDDNETEIAISRFNENIEYRFPDLPNDWRISRNDLWESWKTKKLYTDEEDFDMSEDLDEFYFGKPPVSISKVRDGYYFEPRMVSKEAYDANGYKEYCDSHKTNQQ